LSDASNVGYRCDPAAITQDVDFTSNLTTE
jgi:hypothetical protein